MSGDILDFLPKMKIGQKVMILESKEGNFTGRPL